MRVIAAVASSFEAPGSRAGLAALAVTEMPAETAAALRAALSAAASQ